jgi:hypothetical protein
VHLRLRRKQQPSLWHEDPSPRVILFRSRPPYAEKANCHARSKSLCIFVSAESNNPTFGMGTRAHESYSLGVDLRVRRRRTAT